MGSGIIGVTTAYLLAREGKRVVVLESVVIGGNITCRSTAHLLNAMDECLYELERLHEEKGA